MASKPGHLLVDEKLVLMTIEARHHLTGGDAPAPEAGALQSMKPHQHLPASMTVSTFSVAPFPSVG